MGTHGVALFSSVSSWSLRSWASLEKTGLEYNNKTDLKPPKLPKTSLDHRSQGLIFQLHPFIIKDSPSFQKGKTTPPQSSQVQYGFIIIIKSNLTSDKTISTVIVPEVQKVLALRCCPVCMCRSGGGPGTWPHLSAKRQTDQNHLDPSRKHSACMHEHIIAEPGGFDKELWCTLK